jgi:hypothetical protein
LPRAGCISSPRHRCAVVLEGAQLDQVLVERERRAVPHESVDAVAEERYGEDVVRVGTERGNIGTLGHRREEGIFRRRRGRAARPEEIDEVIRRELRMKGDAEKAALRGEVDRQIENRRTHGAVLDALDLTGVLLDDEPVVLAEKGDADRSRQSADRGAQREVGIHERRPGGLRVEAPGPARREKSARRADSREQGKCRS